MSLKYKYYFTVSAGRTGTAWLAEFFTQNLPVEAIHEPLGIDDFGVNMPDIKLMRSFNERGNNELVRNFWSKKLETIAAKELYVETNHTLCKCGLVENLAESPLAADTLLIVLKRNRVKQCVSYIARYDFRNITMDWQWYLSPTYPNRIVNPEPFLNLGWIGKPLWYVYELDARQRYYVTKYGDRLNFLEVDLEGVTREQGASNFLRTIGLDKSAVMPPRMNAGHNEVDRELFAQVEQLFRTIRYDGQAIVDEYIRCGRSLGPTV